MYVRSGVFIVKFGQISCIARFFIMYFLQVNVSSKKLTVQKIKLFIEDLFSKCDQIHRTEDLLTSLTLS